MSALHERLLARIGTGSQDRAEAALLAVVELHAPKSCAEECCTYCVECDRVPACFVAWPCKTITAIAEALGIGETPK